MQSTEPNVTEPNQCGECELDDLWCYTLTEVAKRLSIHLSTVDDLIISGQLETFNLRADPTTPVKRHNLRVSRRALNAYITSQEQAKREALAGVTP